jgi:hypothetical protein
MEFSETLTANQRIIYNILKEFVRKNPQFTIDNIFLACKRKSSLPPNEIGIILDAFIRKKVIVPGSRLTRATVLDHERRAQIYRFIMANPGVNFSQIVTHFAIGNHSGFLHLSLLEKFNLIRKRKFKIYSLYFPQRFPRTKEVLFFFLRNPNILMLFQCLSYKPLGPYALSKLISVHYSTVRYYFNDLIQYNLIIKDRNLYSPNPDHLAFLDDYFDLSPPPDLQAKIDQHLAKKSYSTLPKDQSEATLP